MKKTQKKSKARKSNNANAVLPAVFKKLGHRWRPKTGTKYWWINIGYDMQVRSTHNLTNGDTMRIEGYNNCFKTEKQAEIVRKKIMKLFEYCW